VNPRFFVDAAIAADTTIALPAAVAHHATRVLRLVAGDSITLFDGSGGEFAATIASVDRDRVTIDVGAFDAVEREAPIAVTLAQAIIATDPMDWAVRKAIELGVAAIVPIIAARSNLTRSGERIDKRVAHWRQIAIAACEQCGRNRVPPIDAPAPLSQWLAHASKQQRIALLAPGAAGSLAAMARERGVDAVVV
jgi:16S rRNA (uracil1498-N3)-methyltransferase